MATAKAESVLRREIARALRARGYVVYTLHGSALAQPGRPDLVCCIGGRFVGFEIKMSGKESTITPMQRREMTSIRKAGGESYMIVSVEDALLLAEAVHAATVLEKI